MTRTDEILNLPAPKSDLRVRYGHDEFQFVDLRLPKAKGPHRPAIIIHGGFWRAKYDLGYAGHMCAALTEKGFATANLEYRRVGNPGGGWPGTFADVRAAYRFLLQNAWQFKLDPARFMVIGHSAGGQLGLCLAAREAGVKAVISLAGVVDLQRAYSLHLSNDAASEFLGGTPSEVADHYLEADPMKLAIRARQWLVHGTDDEVVPPAFSRDYVKSKLQAKAKEDARLVEIAGAGHFDVVDPRSAAWKQVEKVAINAV